MLDYQHVRQLSLALAALAILFVVGTGARAAEVIVGGQYPTFTFSSSISPRFLSRTKPEPVKLGLDSHFFATDPSEIYPPALSQVKLLLDRHLELSTRGLPVCAVGLQAYPSVPVPERCKAAQVGEGKAEVTIAYPENIPLPLDLRVHLYNGGTRRGVTKLWLYFPITVPSPGEILAPIEIRKANQGTYGTEVLMSMPKIADGSGFFTQLWLNINREYGFRGERRSVASFRCANGKFQYSAKASFLDDTQAVDTVGVRTCGVAP